MQPAVFFDRNGTVIEQVYDLNQVDKVRLLPGAAMTINEIRKMGFKFVAMTNPAVIGEGLLTAEGLHDIQAEFDRQLKAEGTFVDAWYFCPEVRTAPDRLSIDHSDRKPGPGMLLRGAKERELDLTDSQHSSVDHTVSDITLVPDLIRKAQQENKT